ncbi:unnamed protein product, partial [Bubo scandiacus]
EGGRSGIHEWWCSSGSPDPGARPGPYLTSGPPRKAQRALPPASPQGRRKERGAAEVGGRAGRYEPLPPRGRPGPTAWPRPPAPAAGRTVSPHPRLRSLRQRPRPFRGRPPLPPSLGARAGPRRQRLRAGPEEEEEEEEE